MKRQEPIGPPAIKVSTMKGIILIDPIKVDCLYEKKAKKKDPKIVLSKDQIKSWNKQQIESSGDVIQVWDEHPDQGVIVALSDEDADMYDLRVGDRIAFNHTDYALIFVYAGKRYYGLRAGEILSRYLTSEV